MKEKIKEEQEYIVNINIYKIYMNKKMEQYILQRKMNNKYIKINKILIISNQFKQYHQLVMIFF